MEIRLAQASDLSRILEIYDSARTFMKSVGNPDQWGSVHPTKRKIEEDINNQKLYAVDDEGILAVFFFDIGNDPTYARIYDGRWLNDKPYGVIHRLAVSDNARGKGISRICFDFAFSKCKNIRIDTHIDNIPMQRALNKYGFTKCGIIHIENGDERIAYQKSEDE
ncbi:MAG: GNAT family N-acetyltransferase [Eubacteriales bacterium]